MNYNLYVSALVLFLKFSSNNIVTFADRGLSAYSLSFSSKFPFIGYMSAFRWRPMTLTATVLVMLTDPQTKWHGKSHTFSPGWWPNLKAELIVIYSYMKDPKWPPRHYKSALDAERNCRGPWCWWLPRLIWGAIRNIAVSRHFVCVL